MPSTKCSAVSGWPSLVGDYTRVDPFEAFVEAFTHGSALPSYQTERDRLYRIDCDTASFFDAITLQV